MVPGLLLSLKTVYLYLEKWKKRSIIPPMNRLEAEPRTKRLHWLIGVAFLSTFFASRVSSESGDVNNNPYNLKLSNGDILYISGSGLPTMNLEDYTYLASAADFNKDDGLFLFNFKTQGHNIVGFDNDAYEDSLHIDQPDVTIIAGHQGGFGDKLKDLFTIYEGREIIVQAFADPEHKIMANPAPMKEKVPLVDKLSYYEKHGNELWNNFEKHGPTHMLKVADIRVLKLFEPDVETIDYKSYQSASKNALYGQINTYVQEEKLKGVDTFTVFYACHQNHLLITGGPEGKDLNGGTAMFIALLEHPYDSE